MRRILAGLMLFSLLVIVSCSTFSSEMRAQTEGVPTWVYAYKTPRLRTSFVGIGTDEDIYRAKLKATLNIIEQLEEILGHPISDNQNRELVTLSSINDYGMFVQNKEERMNPDGTYSVYLLMLANTQLLEDDTTDIKAQKIQFEKDIEQDKEAALKAYGQGYDVEAIKQYLDVANRMIIAGEEESEIEAIVEDVCTIAKRITFSISKVDKEKGTCMVHLGRKNLFFTSDLQEATVKANLQANSFDNQIRNFEYVFSTNNQGVFSFLSPNDSIVKKGSVKFELYLGQSYEEFCKIAPTSLVDKVKKQIESLFISFEYELKSPLRVGLSVIETNAFGDASGNLGSALYISTELENEEIIINLIDSTEVEEEQFIHSLTSERLENDWIVIARLTVDEIKNTENKYYVSSIGYFNIVNAKTLSVVYQSDAIHGVGSASSISEATRASFDNMSMIMSSLLRGRIFGF